MSRSNRTPATIGPAILPRLVYAEFIPITKPCCVSPAILDNWVPTAGRRISIARNTINVTAIIRK
ncbi:hypothetical protein D3C80_2162600 [compost metagenome]